MELYILRHGLAVERTVGLKDRERALTAKGRMRTERLASQLKGLKISFDHILTSPYLRARETAEVLAAKMNFEGKLEFSTHLSPGGSPKAVCKDLQEYEGNERVLVVGHEPDLSQLISWLVIGKSGLKLELKKGGLCRLQMESMDSLPCATLVWLVSPKLLGL